MALLGGLLPEELGIVRFVRKAKGGYTFIALAYIVSALREVKP